MCLNYFDILILKLIFLKNNFDIFLNKNILKNNLNHTVKQLLIKKLHRILKWNNLTSHCVVTYQILIYLFLNQNKCEFKASN